MRKRYAVLFGVLFTVLLNLPVPGPALGADQRGLALRPTAPTGEEVKGNLWLLTIGIDSYLSWPRLKTAAHDARSLKDVLLQRYHLDRSRVIELINEQATRQNILNSFRTLAKQVKPDDSLLIYYAGHGHIDSITGKGSWIPVESGADDPTAWIDNRNITDYLSSNVIKARHVLLVSDSCFSGDFFRGSRGALPAIDDAFLKKAYQRSSRQAISSGGLEPVSDAGFGGNSVFSHFLVAALKNNNKDYLIPSEIFGEVRAGVGKNADQLPQFGDLHGAGGQEGGELILFLKKENRLQGLSADAAARQAELERLIKMETEASQAKQKEQAEIARKQAELDALDRQIAERKGRLGTTAARSSDNLDNIIAMAEQKEDQGRRLEELRRQREEEERKRQQEIARLKKETEQKRITQVKADLAKYQKVAASKYAQDMKGAAWAALVTSYPEAKGVAEGEWSGFLGALGLADDEGEVVSREEKNRRVAARTAELRLAEENRRAEERRLAGEFVFVKGGCFEMGNSFFFGKRDEPVHTVCVSDFYLGKYEVTQGQWQTLMSSNRSAFKDCGDNCPVENVSWNDAQEFISKLNAMTGKQYRLPTEAEWEYAATSGGKKEKYAGTDSESEIGKYAWYKANSSSRTHQVGAKQSNGLGLYDMTGNVREWCQDWYGENYYHESPRNNPQGPYNGTDRVMRGGAWFGGQENVESIRAANRDKDYPKSRRNSNGFRLSF